VGPLVALPGLLAELGVDADAALSEAGLDAEMLARPDNLVPYASLAKVVREAARRAQCPHLGVLLGARWQPEQFGVLWELMQCSTTVGEALHSYTLHQRLYSQSAAAYFAEYPHSAVIAYVVHDPGVDEERPLAHDVGIAHGMALLRTLCGAGFRAIEVELPRARPDDVEPYRRHFGCPVRFDAPHAMIRFAIADARRPLPGADPVRKRAIEDAVAARIDRQLVPLLYRSLRLLLLEGDVSGDALVRQLAIHRRTLNRRLREQGTTFKALLDEVRYDVARELLRDTAMTILEISGAIGYADGSCFTRAFRAWSGLPPAEWRTAHRRPGESRREASGAGVQSGERPAA
jgi:AraC-like DNA-binding protein